MSGSPRYAAPIIYPVGFTEAVLPDEVDVNKCDHENGICFCVHDWRIFWGNVSRDPKPKAVYITE